MPSQEITEILKRLDSVEQRAFWLQEQVEKIAEHLEGADDGRSEDEETGE